MTDSLIRAATAADARSCARIYSPFVTGSVLTFDFEIPTSEDFAARIERLGASHAWLVAEKEGRVLGFAYAGEFRSKAAYAWVCETTIYLDPEVTGRGVGRSLYAALCDALAHRGYRVAIGCIAVPNPASIRLHEACGFERVGLFPRVGFKKDQWIDVVWYQRELGPGTTQSPEISPSR